MNTVDAVCLECGATFRWLIGTPRLCHQCRSKTGTVIDVGIENQFQVVYPVTLTMDNGTIRRLFFDHRPFRHLLDALGLEGWARGIIGKRLQIAEDDGLGLNVILVHWSKMD